MRKIVGLLFFSALILISCKNAQQKAEIEEVEKIEVNYLSFGSEISDEDAISSSDMAERYNNLQEGDTIHIKFASKINEVCSKKGCWMKLDLGEDQEAFVKFKDYGFFMPLNAADREVIVNGKAFLEVTSVKDLRHFAKDAGKSEEEIAKITEPKHTLAFESDGVLMIDK